jgi:transposase
MRFEAPEDLLPPTHPARVLWDVLGTLDLGPFLAETRAVEGEAGRDVLSPRMLLTLWLYGITQSISSAREIARRTKTDRAFRWIVGDLSVSHSRLSDFRVGHREALEALFSDVVGTLLHKDLASLEVAAQDGMRVRASASAPSFRMHKSLLECREQANLHLKAVLAEADDAEVTAREHAARQAAARDYQLRVEAAIETVQDLQAQRSPSARPARASTTDAQARVMKMADGGFRPAYNVQAVTAGHKEGGPRTVIAVQVTNVGSDMNAVGPMLDRIDGQTGRLPDVLLADANHAGHAGIENASERGVEVIIPVPERSKAPASGDPRAAIESWKKRMETPEAKAMYRQRAGLCELTNAHMRNYGMDRFLVRGIGKVSCVALMTALAMNLVSHAAKLLA